MKINILLICIHQLSLSKEIMFVILLAPFNADLEEPFQSTAWPQIYFSRGSDTKTSSLLSALHICKSRTRAKSVLLAMHRLSSSQ